MRGSITLRFISSVLVICTIIYACSQRGGDVTGANPCFGVTITVTATLSHPTGAATTDGKIVATASGGTGMTYSINGGSFQSSGTFSNLTAGSYIVTARNSSGCSNFTAFTLVSQNPCTGSANITVNTTASANSPCQVTGTAIINASASGGASPYTYCINGGPYQSSGAFYYLSSGGYTVIAKDVNGCTGSAFTNVNDLPAGPLFGAVKALVQSNCVSCHNSIQTEGGMNFTNDCNIVANKTRIKNRAVDGYPTAMPTTGLLPASERQKITSWINAGGQYTN